MLKKTAGDGMKFRHFSSVFPAIGTFSLIIKHHMAPLFLALVILDDRTMPGVSFILIVGVFSGLAGLGQALAYGVVPWHAVLAFAIAGNLGTFAATAFLCLQAAGPPRPDAMTSKEN